MLSEDHPDRLASQHELAGTYWANGQIKEAVKLLEHVIGIEARVLACPAAILDAENLKVSIWISDGQHCIGWPEPSKSPKQIPDLFVRLLTSMPNLRKLDWDTFENGHEEFKQAFADANLTLPIRKLIPAPFSEFLVDACLNTEDLRSGGSITSSYLRGSTDADPRVQLINSTRYLSKLTTFGMRGEWEIRHLEGILNVEKVLLHLLTRLSAFGNEAACQDCVDRWRNRAKKTVSFQCASWPYLEYLDVLRRFTNLETLRLPPSSALALGSDGGPACGNAYFGRNGRGYGRQVARDGAAATEKAGRMALAHLPHLRALDIGGYRANISTSSNGSVSATWPWSMPGMQNWSYTIFPQQEIFPGEDDDSDGLW